MKWILKLGLLAALLSCGHQAYALPRLIDFTDSAWAAAEGQSSYSVAYGSLTVQLNSLQGARPMTFNAPGPAGPPYLNRNGSGIGIIDGEITYIPGDQDLLEVKFSEPVTVTSLYFLKFGTQDAAQANFGRNGPNTILGFNGTPSGFGAFEGLSVTNFDDIHFTANTGGYSLLAIGLDGYVVPEPMSVVPALAALLPLRGMARRHRIAPSL